MRDFICAVVGGVLAYVFAIGILSLVVAARPVSAATYTVVAPTSSPGSAAQPTLGETFYNPGNLPTFSGQGSAFSGGPFWVSNDHPSTLLDFGQPFQSVTLEFQDAFDQNNSFFRVNGVSLIPNRQSSGALNVFQFNSVSSLLFETKANDGFAFRVVDSIPSTIPLPAGAVLLLTALGFISVIRRKTK